MDPDKAVCGLRDPSYACMGSDEEVLLRTIP